MILDKSIEEDLRAFGLENFESSKSINQNDSEWYRFASEIRLSDVKVDVHKLQNHHKKLTEDILKSQKSINALKEWVFSKHFAIHLVHLISCFCDYQMSSHESKRDGNQQGVGETQCDYSKVGKQTGNLHAFAQFYL